MGSTLLWHRRHALMLAGQLPENIQDAELVLEAIHELMDEFLKGNRDQEPQRHENVLPFIVS